MATNEDINIRVHSEGGERAIGITPEQTERGIGIDQEAIVVRSVKSYNDLDDKPQINSVELDGNKSASDLGFADVAMSGSYNDLTDTPEIPAAQVNADWNADSGVAEILNKPTIPTKTSQLDNDSGFITSESDPVFSASAAATITSQDITDWDNKSDFSGSYNDLTNKPTIPTKTSDLTNDGADNTSVYVEADELATVATSGSYNDLENKPTIPAAQVNSDWNADSGVAQILNKPTLATVATSGDYDDLINKPAAMTVDSALSWTSQNPVENQAIRKTIYVKNSSDDREAGINIAFSNPNLNPYVHLGSKTSATKGINSVGIGNNAESSAVRSVAIGDSATASKREGVALGPNATAGQYSLSIGYYTETVPNYSTAVGPYAKVLTGATNATAIGYQSEASEAETVSVGKSTKKRRIVNVADGTTATDAATVGQIPTKTSDLTNDGADNTSTYVEADELATVATSGSYSDLSGTPTIPTKTSDLTNDGADNTSTYVEADELAAVATSGSYNDLSDKPTIPGNMVVLSYGSSTWNDFITAYNDNRIVYCRASSNANPGTGTQGRMAFMAYLNNPTAPTSVEFQYVRSVSSKSASQQGDQVYVYTLTNANGGTWSVVTREMSTKIAAGTNMSSSYSSGTLTLSATVPTKTSDLTNDGSDNTSTYVEADELATVATSGLYSDLTGTPTIPAAQVNSDWNSNSGVSQILNKPSLATVATSGSYSDLTGTPTIPTVNNATLTIQKNGTDVQTFTANQSTNATANITVPTKTSDLTNDGSDNTSTYVEADQLAAVATSGSYNDLTNKPTIPAAQVNSDWNASSGVAQILNKPTLATVATSGSYNDLSNKPTIPTVNNATLTIQKNGTSVGTFTANASANVTANITVPTQTSDLTNNSGFLTSSTAVTSFNGSTGAITYTAPVTSVNGSTGAITGLQTTSNLVTSVSGSSTDSQYPSAKLFYDTIGNVETILNTLNNGGGAQ